MARARLTNSERKYNYYKWNTRSKSPGNPIMSYKEWREWQITKGRDPDSCDLRQKQPNAYSKLRFQRHRAQAKYRNIPFEFDWETWHQWWAAHGIDRNIPSDERGADRMCMCRIGDTGAYSPDNVYLATLAQNSTDAKANGRSRGGRRKGSKNRSKG